MALNTKAKIEYNKLSTEAKNRIDTLITIVPSNYRTYINKILTLKEWQDLSNTLFGKPSLFDIGTIDNLDTLLKDPKYEQQSKKDASNGAINSIFNKHYRKLIMPSKTATTSVPSGTIDDDYIRKKENRVPRIARLLKNAYNIILHGAPGTGKTYLAKQIAKELGCSDEQIKMVQFHPSYDYTDFMEGLRPVKDKSSSAIGFERRNGAFKEFCKNAIKAKKSITEEDKTEIELSPFVFIIDEINRGEISKILGECMFSIDPGYVGEDGRIETQYQNLIDDTTDPFKDGFYRPDNVYIIGTMNDIDRGVEAMDLAMRRRFQFIEIKAGDTQSEILKELKDSDLIEEASKRMDNLNKEIRDTPVLGEDYCIGASYFLKVKNFTDDKWKNLWDYHLVGLLKEYVRGLEDNSLIDKFSKAYNQSSTAEKEDSEEN